MKLIVRTIIVSILLFTCATYGLAQSTLTPPPKRKYKYEGKIVNQYSEAKDLTVVLIQLMPVHDVEDPRDILDATADKPRRLDRLSFTVFFTHPGKTVVTPKEVSIGFTYMALDPEKYGDHTLTAKIDGERITLGKLVVLSTSEVSVQFAYKRYTRRALELVIPYHEFLRMATAKKVRLKIGDFEFALSKDHMEALRDLASRTVP